MHQASYFRSRPPRCIAGFIARPAESPGVEFDGHASLSQLKIGSPTGVTIDAPEHSNPVFALCCSCGGHRHYVHCYRWAAGLGLGSQATAPAKFRGIVLVTKSSPIARSFFLTGVRQPP